MEGILYINILMGPTKYLILVLVDSGVLINVILSWLAQWLEIKIILY